MRPRTTRIAPLVALFALVALPTMAAYLSEQVQSLEQLRAASTTPVEIHFRAGFPYSIRMSLPATGATSSQRVRGFLATYADLFQQDHPKVEWVHVGTSYEPGHGSTVRFAQRYEGYPVFGAELVVVERQSVTGGGFLLTSAHGAALVPAVIDRIPAVELEIDLTPAILPQTAEQIARDTLGEPEAAVGGTTAMMIYDPELFGEPGTARLVWRVTLTVDVGYQLLIDANDSQPLRKIPMAPTSNGLDDFDMSLYHSNGGNISDTGCTTIAFQMGSEGGVLPAYQGDHDTSAAWHSARDTYLMFHDVLGRHSFDNDDGKLRLFVHALYSNGQGNAKAVSGCGIEFATGWVGKDIVAHEFAHLTTQLTYSNQSGALNESYADVMATAVDSDDWLIGEAMASGDGPIRNMANPSYHDCNGNPCPSRMSQFINTGLDSGGVHWNSNIINKAYQLFADGGSQGNQAVLGQGRTRMALLAYRTTMGLPSNANFLMARNAAVTQAHALSAWGLDGFTPQSVCSVRNAFAAVEIGAPDDDCNGVEDGAADPDNDGVASDGDGSGSTIDNRCHGSSIGLCDDNCPTVANPTQADWEYDGWGDACDLDDDNDGTPDTLDRCPGVNNRPWDTDGDGIPACLDEDDDDDGVTDDGDNSGSVYDNPCPSGVTQNCDDNCPGHPNPSQFDGDNNGQGDACDPDLDGDGFYQQDNCPFTTNPTQLDTDGDGLGDACDACPATSDTPQAWHPGYPDLDIPPYPIQPDSDGDGIPDACDITYGIWGGSFGNAPYSATNAIRADDSAEWFLLEGPPGVEGDVVRLPIFPCDDGTGQDLPANEHFELVLENLPETIVGWVEQGDGRVLTRIQPQEDNPDLRGLRFKPRCDQEHFLVLRPDENFEEPAEIYMIGTTSPASDNNPWGSADGQFNDPPPPLPDEDGDGLVDSLDTCPTQADPTDNDGDGDDIGDVCDLCPTLTNPDQGPVAFSQIRADKRSTPSDPIRFEWDGPLHESGGFNYITGTLDSLQSYAIWSQGNASGTSHVPQTPMNDSMYYLYRHPDPCGTWGSPTRDASFPP